MSSQSDSCIIYIYRIVIEPHQPTRTRLRDVRARQQTGWRMGWCRSEIANCQVSRNCLHQNWQTVPVLVSNILLVVTAVRIVYFYDWQLMLILWQTARHPPATFGNFFLDRWYWGMWTRAPCISLSEWEDRTGCLGKEGTGRDQAATNRMTNIFQLLQSNVSWPWLS